MDAIFTAPPITILTLTGAVLILFAIIKVFRYKIKFGSFEIGSRSSCEFCKNREIERRLIAFRDATLKEQYKKMDEASDMLRKNWFYENFKTVWRAGNFNIKSDVTETKEFLRYSLLLSLFEVKEKEVTKKLIQENGLVSVFCEGYIPEYLETKHKYLFSKTAEFFDNRYKHMGIDLIPREILTDEEKRTEKYFKFVVYKLFTECVIIALQCELIADRIRAGLSFPEIEEIPELFRQKWGISKTELYNRYITKEL